MSTTTEKPKWGDLDPEEDELDIQQGENVFETHADEHGVKYRTVVTYDVIDGRKAKITRKYRVYKKQTKINKSVVARKKWKKFGDCAGLPPGLEPGVTTIGDEVEIERSADLIRREGAGAENDKKKIPQGADMSGFLQRLKERRDGGESWTDRASRLGRAETWDEIVKKSEAKAEAGGKPLDNEPTPGELRARKSGAGAYVPPHLRGSAGGATSGGEQSADDRANRDLATVRVTNLSEDTSEQDLSELFRPFGPIQRIYLAKDKLTGLSKGFAFINYYYREDAARAIQKLSGYGYDHLILHVEWAKPSTRGF